ncbi:MAG TPA: hypothetical protein VHL53_23985 [Acidimicrobiia bacterium]|nr:hypothetical protein [Acidimicrobiia bacterium]
MPELAILRFYLSAALAQLRALQDGERGSITLEQILITTTLVAGAIAAGVLIMNRINDAARAIPTGQ